MIRWIVKSSMALRFLVIVLAIVLLVYGFTQLRAMPVDVFPEFDPPLVEVQTEALGLSAAEVESLITVPMEADLLNGVAWLDRLYSESVAGLSSILLIFEPGTDPIRARQMVQERLTQAHALPNVSKPPVMLQPLSASSRVMMVGLSSDDLSLIEMGVLARWNIKPRLMGVPGVANVAIWGQRERQLQVLVDPAQLHAAGVTLDQVIQTTGEALWVSPLSYLEASSPGTSGWIDTPNQRLSIRHLLPISTPEELAKVAIAGNEGLLLGDVTQVVEDHQPLIGDAVLNNGPGLLLVIEKFPGANTLEVTRGVEDALKALQPGLGGIQIDTTVFRPANYIELAARNLGILLLIGAALLTMVLAAFFFQWRTTLISLVAIPLSLMAAVFVLYLRGATFNAMILAGLVLALVAIIDDAIIDVEQIARRFRERRQAGSTASAEAIILEASAEMRGAIGFALLIMLLAVAPIFLLPGLTGAFLQPLAVSYILALFVSVAVALIVTPALSLTLLANTPSGQRQPPLIAGLQRAYNGLAGWSVQSPILALIIAAIVILIGAATLPFLQQELLPPLKRAHLLIQFEAAPGTSGPEMNRIMAQASEELQAIPGVRNVGSHVGRAITGDAVVGINSAEMWVNLDTGADYEATVAAIRNVVDGYPGLFRQVQNYQPERIGEALTAPANDLVVRIYGHDMDILREKAAEVSQLLAGIGGVVAATPDIHAREPQVEIEANLQAAEQHGLKPGDIRRQAATLLSGLQVGNLFDEQKVFDVVVWGVPEMRQSLSNINQLQIDTPGGEQVPLGEVADVRIVPSETIIKRDAVSRYIDVGVEVNGRGLSAVTADVQSALQGVAFPFEFHAEILSESMERQISQQRMLAILAGVLVGIFLLLQAAFGTWRMALAGFFTLPMALSGGLVAALIGGGVLSLGSLFGLLAVLGIAVRNTITMIRHCQHLEQVEGATFGPELVVRSARERAAPIVMTALATGAALLPLLVAGNIPGNETIAPMAVVIFGGLVTSTVFSLLIVPALYLRFGAAIEPAAIGEPLQEEPGLGIA